MEISINYFLQIVSLYDYIQIFDKCYWINIMRVTLDCYIWDCIVLWVDIWIFYRAKLFSTLRYNLSSLCATFYSTLSYIMMLCSLPPPSIAQYIKTNDKILQISMYNDGLRTSYCTIEITNCATSSLKHIMRIITRINVWFDL